MNKMYIVLAALLLVILIGSFFWLKGTPSQNNTIKIGVLTDLTGPASAYWGESAQAGAELAARDLKAGGYNIEMVYEDYQLDAAKAASGAQKLITADKVDGLYIEFNPAILTVDSLVAQAHIPMIYDAAVVSSLKESSDFFKTYLDYEEGCKEIAQKFKDEGVQKVGMLKISLEAGQLCLDGVAQIYPSVVVEGYNLGNTDFRTSLLKMKSGGVVAVINAGFEDDVYNILKQSKDLGYNTKFGLVDDTLTPKTLGVFSPQLKGSWSFGFKPIPADFAKRVDAVYDKTYPTYYGAALAYTHILQLAQSLADCKKNIGCTTQAIAHSKPSGIVGFRGFQDRIANLDMQLKQY